MVQCDVCNKVICLKFKEQTIHLTDISSGIVIPSIFNPLVASNNDYNNDDYDNENDSCSKINNNTW